MNRRTFLGAIGAAAVAPALLASKPLVLNHDLRFYLGPVRDGAILQVGDTFTLAGFDEVDPVTRQSTGKLKRFRVTAAHSNTTT